MPLSSGAKLGPYEILSPLGKGGMGEVYSARDTRLDRTVAIKILPTHLSAEAERRERFEREARVISSLNHPHICTLYDVGRQDGTDYLVMEYLDGESLAQRLTKGPLPLDQALKYAIEVADALDKAHRHGVIHRDLKPANIMLTKAGATLLDFGLAKFRGADASPVLGDLPTQQASLTAEGTVLGTFQYMAPEQLEGKEADARTDLFAFGAVLYEMVTGQRAFSGKSQASLISAIMSSEPPPISRIQAAATAAVEKVLSICLAKDPDARWQSAHDLMTVLTWVADGASFSPAVRNRDPRFLVRFAGLALMLVTLAVIAAFLFVNRGSADRARLKFELPPPPEALFSILPADVGTVSPDGKSVAFVATRDRRKQLWVRSLDSLNLSPLAGTEGASYPFWAPDSQSLGFFSEGKLKRIALAGGPAQTICETRHGYGGSWNAEDVILFAPSFSEEGLYRVPAGGGKPESVTHLDPALKESAHRWPHFLPDGRHFLYLSSVSTGQEENAIYLGSLDSRERKRLLSVDSRVAYAPPGYLLFVRDGALLAQPFDAEQHELAGNPVPIAESVGRWGPTGESGFSVSMTGVLAFWSSGPEGHVSELVWFDRAGKRLSSVGQSGLYHSPDLSPNGHFLAVGQQDAIVLFDLRRGVRSRLAEGSLPIWSPDGQMLVFESNREGPENLYQKDVSGAGTEELFYGSELAHKHPQDWSRDGKFILYSARHPKSGSDLVVLPTQGEREPRVLFESLFEENLGQFSPSGRWVAYVSDETGRPEVYVRTFVASAVQRWQISTDGGVQPRWRDDERELFYLSENGEIMSVEIDPGQFSPGVPRPLFQTRLPALFAAYFEYAVDRSGQRFLIKTPAEEVRLKPITVVINWSPSN